jgi:hypothetical protein
VAKEICDLNSACIVVKENSESDFFTAVPIDTLPASEDKEARVAVRIASTTVPFSKTKVRFSLQIRPPDNSPPDLIQHYEFPIQVCNEYRHSPDANVLFIANLETSKDEVDYWNSLVCQRLGMTMDTFNASEYGHLKIVRDGSGSRSLFDLYHGKIVIMLGNKFEYFERGQRTALDLINQEDFAVATRAGTSLTSMPRRSP